MKWWEIIDRIQNIFIFMLVMFSLSVCAYSGVRPNRVIRTVSPLAMSTKVNSTETHLYFPLLKNGPDYISYVGLVNVDSHTVSFTLHVLDQEGIEAMEPVEGSLEPMGRYYAPVSDVQLEGNLWGEVISDGHLTGYLNLLGRNGTRSIFVRASQSLEKQLYLPHIAPEIQYWNTYTAIVNGNRSDNEASNVFLDYIAGTKPLNGPIKPMSQYWCEWAEDVFSDVFPEGMPFWGKIWNNVSAEKSDNVIAGMELFVRKGEGIHQECGLDLSSKTATTLYFPHIDVNGQYWWTGIAIENVSTGPATVIFQPFDASGTALTPVNYDLTASEKLVKVVQSFWTDKDLDFPTDTAWIQVSTVEGRLIGYELFGTLDAKGYRLLAGINAPSAGNKTLLYPHVDSSDAFWTGIAAVNIGTEAGTVTATAYDNSGKTLKTITISNNLAPNQKIVNTVKAFFTDNESSGPPENTSMIILDSDQPIVGFELWGNLTPEQDYISGMLATPLPPTQLQEGFERDNYTAENAVWELWPLSDNQDQGLGWDLASLTSYGTSGTFHDIYEQSVPDGFDYIVGFYGDQNIRNHQILVSPVITLPDNVAETSFYSQFGWPDYAEDADAFYVTQDIAVGEGWSLDTATTLKTFTKEYIQTLPLSNEPKVNTDDVKFTRWKRESYDISTYAGKTVRFIFEINSVFGESWHIDRFEVK
ncbi:MAG: hypothetical protein GXO70_00015 [Acidobacteria bacterium]|nr:hypothetical protein [Acidobacteriota bacterium]